MARVQRDTAQANERAAELEKEALTLRLELAKRLQRVILPEDRTEIIARLKNAPKGHVTVIAHDAEQGEFGRDIANTLSLAGFGTTAMYDEPASSPRAISGGVALWIKDASHPPSIAKPILEAFASFGMVEMDRPSVVPDAETVWIVLGPRP
jgi:hypothetical protein